MLDSVSDTRLLRVDRITFDDAILSALLSATPTALADAAARLRAGEPPRALLMDGSVTPRDLEQQLRELARRGAIVFVTDGMGQDMIGSARAARDSMPGALMHATSRDAELAPAGAVRRGSARRRGRAAASAAPSQPQPPSARPPQLGYRPPSRARRASRRGRDRRAGQRARTAANVVEAAGTGAARGEPEPAPFTVQSTRLHSGPPRATPSQAPARSRAWPGMALVAVLAAAGFAGARWYAQHDAPARCASARRRRGPRPST